MLCFDLEATCDEIMESEAPRPLAITPREMETIEVGLVVLDLRSLQIVETFQRYVRPTLHPVLTSFCKNLTSIKQSDVDHADIFPKVMQQLSNFLKKYPCSLWTSWGHYDADQLAIDGKRTKCSPILLNMTHVDLENLYRKIFSCSSMGLKPAVEALDLKWNGKYHRGIDDAENLASMAGHLFGIKHDAPFGDDGDATTV